MIQKNEIIQIVSSVRFGGPERYALDISRYLSASGWKVTAFTRDAKAVDSTFREAGIRLRHAPLGGLMDLSSALILARMMKRMPQGRGVVHVHHRRDAFTALLARKIARRRDIRVVLTVHTVKKGRDTALARRIYRNLDAMIFVSKRVSERFLSTWKNRELPMPKRILHILHNSLYLPGFELTDPPVRGPLIAMFHGPIKRDKGLEYLIDALPQLKGLKVRLRIVGSGDPDYVDSLRRRAQSRGVMEMIDWKKPAANSLLCISEAHIGVLPSIGEEAFGLSNTEYMLAGRPQVCTARGAQREYLVDGKEAFIIPPGDTQAIADALRRLATDPDLRRRMGLAANAAFSRRLSWPHFAGQLLKIYSPRQ